MFASHAAELSKAEQERVKVDRVIILRAQSLVGRLLNRRSVISLQGRDWDKFTECTPLPDVVDSRALHSFVRLVRAKEDNSMQVVLGPHLDLESRTRLPVSCIRAALWLRYHAGVICGARTASGPVRTSSRC